jgi:hypothetical protein
MLVIPHLKKYYVIKIKVEINPPSLKRIFKGKKTYNYSFSNAFKRQCFYSFCAYAALDQGQVTAPIADQSYL